MDEGYESDPLLSPVCKFNRNDEKGYWFDLMNQYHGMGGFLKSLSIFTILIYFVTSSDSGSMVVDLIASNGAEAHPIQRIYWAFTEGAVAIALFVAGGGDALQAVQAASIISGVPFTLFVCLICVSLWRTLQWDQGDFDPDVNKEWKMPLYAGVFNAFEFVFSFGKAPPPTLQQVKGFFLCLFVPPVGIYFTIKQLRGDNDLGTILVTVISAITWIFLIVCICVTEAESGMAGMTFAAYLGFTTIVTYVHQSVREKYGCEGSACIDFVAAWCVYPQVVLQAWNETNEADIKDKTTSL